MKIIMMGGELKQMRICKKKNKVIVLLCITFVIIGLIGIYTGYHQWNDATCTKPKTCKICGRTDGEALGHTWNDATCTEPQICSVCHATKGDALGHELGDWTIIKEATCTATGEEKTTCKRCGKSLEEEIPMIEHSLGEWTVTDDYKVNRDGTVTPGTQAMLCTVCNSEIETKEYTIELTNGQKNAVIRAYEEESFWHVSRDYLIYDILVGFDYFSVEDATFAVDHMDVDFDEQAVLYVRENSSGQSKGEIIEMMRYYGYTDEQIDNALEQAGF